jgi:hypothetical protein
LTHVQLPVAGFCDVHPVVPPDELELPPVEPPAGAMPGGSQLPFEQVQLAPGLIVVQFVDAGGGSDGGGVLELLLPPVLGGAEPGGSQLPFEHVQVGPGLIVVQPVEGGGVDGGGVLEPLLPPVLGGALGGSQLPFEHVQLSPGLTLVQVPDPPELDPPDGGGVL